ncbi:MAG: hypothetical protein IPF75_18435 [Bacteroidetes bacterium]|nr:hypothetical protein [Bacteroidota bacterium]
MGIKKWEMKGKQFTLKEGLGRPKRINKEQAIILNTIPTSIVLLDKNGIIIKIKSKINPCRKN